MFLKIVLETELNLQTYGIFFALLLLSTWLLTLSSIYTHFNTMKKKAVRKHCGKGEIAQNEQFHLFPQRFLCNLYLKIL